jgi:hypothetical protein
LGGTASTSLGRTRRSGLLLRSNGCALLYFGDLAEFTSDGGIRSHSPRTGYDRAFFGGR